MLVYREKEKGCTFDWFSLLQVLYSSDEATETVIFHLRLVF